MRTVRHVPLALAVITVALLAACEKRPDRFCCTSADSCAEFPGQEITPCTDPAKPYCDDTGEYGPRHDCIPDPMATACEGPADCTNPARPYCVNEACVACRGPGNEDCEPAAPVCSEDTHLCGACSGDPDCADRADTPRCLVASGACVACLDGGDCANPTPVCETATNECRSCEAHAECGSEVCNRESGACLAEADVIYLSPTGQASGTCTRTSPCNSFALGLAQVTGSRNTIKAAPGTYTGQIVIDGVTVTVFADGASITPGGLLAELVVVTNGADASIEGATIDGAGGSTNQIGVSCRLSSTLRLKRSTVVRNGGGGVSVSACQYSIVNNIIALNGGTTSTFGGMQIGNIAVAGSHEFQFNTITANTGATNATTGVECASILIPLAFTNSIIYGNGVATGTPIQAGGDSDCSWSYSNIGPQAVAGTGNINSAPTFVNPASRNFRLLAGSAGIDVADPAATLANDIDLDDRPCGGGRDMGADEVCP